MDNFGNPAYDVAYEEIKYSNFRCLVGYELLGKFVVCLAQWLNCRKQPIF